MKKTKLIITFFSLLNIANFYHSSLYANFTDHASDETKAIYYDAKVKTKDAYKEVKDKTEENFDYASDKAKSIYYDAKVKAKDATDEIKNK